MSDGPLKHYDKSDDFNFDFVSFRLYIAAFQAHIDTG
jgi:hypothetical protein